MKIYVFTYHAASGCEFMGVNNEVFRTREDALDAFKKWREDEMMYVHRDELKIGTDTEDHFEAYEEGDYCCNHTEGFVNEYEI